MVLLVQKLLRIKIPKNFINLMAYWAFNQKILIAVILFIIILLINYFTEDKMPYPKNYF
jgi:hypothetical protein